MTEERVLIGKWIEQGDRVVGDEICKRIEKLIADCLRRVGNREGGWTVLYLDDETGIYWELTFPESGMHGGGPPALTRLEFEEVKTLYPDLQR
jgi:hypothetical protein